MTHPELIERITRSLAYMLRHQPEQFDLQVDEYGFADMDDVVQALNERLGEPVEPEDVHVAVESGDRIRYEIADSRIRALYGHSIEVKPGEPSKPPEMLYVGVSKDDADRARRYGLRAGRRSFLHLALTPEDALETGRRASRDYVVITVHALEAWEEGLNFYDRKALFLSDPIPTHLLHVGDVHTDGYGAEDAPRSHGRESEGRDNSRRRGGRHEGRDRRPSFAGSGAAHDRPGPRDGDRNSPARAGDPSSQPPTRPERSGFDSARSAARGPSDRGRPAHDDRHDRRPARGAPPPSDRPVQAHDARPPVGARRDDRRPRADDRGARDDRGPRHDQAPREDHAPRDDRAPRAPHTGRPDSVAPRADRGAHDEHRAPADRGARGDRAPYADRGARPERGPHGRSDRNDSPARDTRSDRSDRPTHVDPGSVTPARRESGSGSPPPMTRGDGGFGLGIFEGGSRESVRPSTPPARERAPVEQPRTPAPPERDEPSSSFGAGID